MGDWWEQDSPVQTSPAPPAEQWWAEDRPAEPPAAEPDPMRTPADAGEQAKAALTLAADTGMSLDLAERMVAEEHKSRFERTLMKYAADDAGVGADMAMDWTDLMPEDPSAVADPGRSRRRERLLAPTGPGPDRPGVKGALFDYAVVFGEGVGGLWKSAGKGVQLIERLITGEFAEDALVSSFRVGRQDPQYVLGGASPVPGTETVGTAGEQRAAARQTLPWYKFHQGYTPGELMEAFGQKQVESSVGRSRQALEATPYDARWWGIQLFEQAPQLAVLVASGRAHGRAVSLALIGLLEGGQVKDAVETGLVAEGMDPAEARLRSDVAGAAAGIVNALLENTPYEEFVEGPAQRSVLVGLMRGFAANGPIEGLQELVSYTAERQAGLPADPNVAQRIWRAVLAGGAVGGAFGGARAGAARIGKGGTATPKPAVPGEPTAYVSGQVMPVSELADRVAEPPRPSTPPEAPKTTIPEQAAPEAESGQIVPPEPAQALADPVAEVVQAAAGPTPRPTVTGIKNAVVDAERAARGQPALVSGPALADDVVWQGAMAALEADPTAGYKLVEELQQAPRAVTAQEEALLMHHKVAVNNAFYKANDELVAAEQARDTGLEVEKRGELERAAAELERLDQVGRSTGTAWGRAGQFRQRLAAEDYTLAAMTARRRAAVGRALTDAETDQVRDLHAKLEAAERTTAEAQQKVVELEARARLEALIKDAAPKARRGKGAKGPAGDFGARNRFFTQARHAAARQRLKQRLAERGGFISGEQGGIDPQAFADLVTEAGYYLEGAGRDAAAWMADMARDYGSAVTPDQLDEAWQQAQREYGQFRRNEQLARAERQKGGQRADETLGQAANQIARTFVEEGMTDREAVIDAVHAELQRIAPEITRRQTMDAISGYGQYGELSKQDVDVALRELRGEMQQLAKIEDMEGGQAPLKTGKERRTPSDEERRLIRKVNELKKQGGYDMGDPARQLATAMQTTERRLQHQIADLEHAIETGEPLAGRGKGPTNEDIQALRERLKDLRKQYQDIFAARGLSDTQRAQRAIAAVERSIKEYERRIAEGDLWPGKPTKAARTAELAAAEARRDALKAELLMLQQADPNYKARSDERARAAYRARLANMRAALAERIAHKDFAPRPRKPLEMDLRTQAEWYAYDQVKRRFNEMLLKDRRARRAPLAKALAGAGEAVGVVRALKASLDASMVGIQNIFFTLSAPVYSAKALARTLPALFSERGEYAIEHEIMLRRNYPLYERFGLQLTRRGASLAEMEEQFQSRLSEKIPAVAGSGRFFSSFLNLMRANMFDYFVETLSRNGAMTDTEYRNIANVVNAGTGRGGPKSWGPALVAFNRVFWSPRNWLARGQLLMGQPMWGGTWRTRKLIAKQYGKALGAVALIYGIAGLVGMDLEDDPTSPFFGQLHYRDGDVDVYIDFLGGLAQLAVLLNRQWFGETTTLAGETVPLRGEEVPYGGRTVEDVQARFVRQKLAPELGAVEDVLVGKTVTGKKVTVGTTAESLLVPISAAEVAESMRDRGIPEGTILGMLQLLGVRVTIIDPNRERGE